LLRHNYEKVARPSFGSWRMLICGIAESLPE
jgi:hypothetical protein